MRSITAIAIGVVVAFALFVGRGSSVAGASSAPGSVNVVVIPGFDPPTYPGFKGVPPFPVSASQLSGFNLSELDQWQVTPAALQPFDTVVLYGARWSALSAGARSAINGFARTGKVLIWDADATGSQNYSDFVHPFSTTASGEVTERRNGSVVSYPSGDHSLASSDSENSAYLDPAALVASTHLVTDMSVMNPGAAEWAPALVAANATLPSGGWILAWAYGSTSDHTGLVIYSGMDADAFADQAPNYALKELRLQLLAPFERSKSGCSPNCAPPEGGSGSGSGLGDAGTPTFAHCSFVRLPTGWARRRLVLSLNVAVAAGTRGEIRSPLGALLAAHDAAPNGTLDIPLNTRLLPSNRSTSVQVVVYVNAAKACTLSASLKVDNVAPRLLSKSVRAAGSRWRVTLKPSEAVKLKLWSRGRLLRIVTTNRSKKVSLLMSTRPTRVTMVDRAHNDAFALLIA